MRNATSKYEITLGNLTVYQGYNPHIAVDYYRHCVHSSKEINSEYYGKTVKMLIDGKTVLSFCVHNVRKE